MRGLYLTIWSSHKESKNVDKRRTFSSLVSRYDRICNEWKKWKITLVDGIGDCMTSCCTLMWHEAPRNKTHFHTLMWFSYCISVLRYVEDIWRHLYKACIWVTICAQYIQITITEIYEPLQIFSLTWSYNFYWIYTYYCPILICNDWEQKSGKKDPWYSGVLHHQDESFGLFQSNESNLAL